MTRKRRLALSCCVLAALGLPLGALAQGHRVGSEFQVNTYTLTAQSYPSVAADADGDFAVAWRSNAGTGSGLFARRFASAGTPQASDFQVNTITTINQALPVVAASSSGDFVIVWEGYLDGSSLGVFAHRFSSDGTPLAAEFQVNTYTASSQRSPAVAASPSGDFVVAWESYAQDGSNDGVFARRFSSAGTPLADEFQVNTYTTEHQRSASVATNGNGDFVVAWTSNGQDGAGLGVFARGFSSAGAPLTGELQVNAYTEDSQRYPAAALDLDRHFVVVWGSNNQDGSAFGVFVRSFSSAGTALVAELQVNVFTTGSQVLPAVRTGAGSEFVVAWSSLEDGSGFGIFARRLSSAGAPLGDEVQVNTYTTGNQHRPTLATSDSGDFIVAWQDNARDGSSYGVFAQRFAALATLDVDGNGALGPLTDGLLVLRFLFGFTGTTLTGGVIGNGCTRCDADAIQPYLAGLGLVIDVDGNTTPGALTDGLLALRYLFGFTGGTLTTGVVGGGCGRCDAPSIEAYLAGLTT
jgi:hypothetical protein